MGKENKATMCTLEIGEVKVPFRYVHINDLDDAVRVTTESVLREHITEGDELDDQFYCYVEDEKFYTMSNEELKEYVNKTFS